MDTVDLTLNHYSYRFRRLTFREEFGLAERPGDDILKTVLVAALTEVSGLPIESLAERERIIGAIPPTVRNRMWILYRDGLPLNRFFSTTQLYRAPDPNQLERIHQDSEEKRASQVDQAFAQMEQRFGKQEVAETLATERALIEDARKRGTLRPATPDPEPAKGA